MRVSDRHALLAGVLLLSILIGFGANQLSWDWVSKLAWSVAALLSVAMVILLLKTTFLDVYWVVWRMLPRKNLRRGGRVLNDYEAETVRINVKNLIAEYEKVPRFNFK